MWILDFLYIVYHIKALIFVNCITIPFKPCYTPSVMDMSSEYYTGRQSPLMSHNKLYHYKIQNLHSSFTVMNTIVTRQRTIDSQPHPYNLEKLKSQQPTAALSDLAGNPYAA